MLPASQTGTVGKKLKFSIQAFDPDPLDAITLNAFGLPSGLTFTERHHRLGTVSGSVKPNAGQVLRDVLRLR